jgi:nitrate/TMAO reductase-like tetraheme cytochrome c subunit
MKIPELPKLSKRTWGLIVAILVLLAAIPGLGLVRFTTGHPFFCLSCHRNQDVPEMWLASRVHPASVTCTECHAPPGEIIPRKFSASDELMNQNCRRCHDPLPGGEQTTLQSVRVVFVSHKRHAEKGALCTDCHRNLEHDKSSPRTNRPTMESCYRCHQAHPRSQACNTCHPINLVYPKEARGQTGG